MTTTDEDAGPTPRESAPSAATARPRVELARALDRDTLRRILDRIALGKTLTPAERHALRRVTTAEQDEVDDLREQVLDARNIHEGARLAVSDALSLGTGAPWDALVERARRLDATERNSRADVAAARQAEQQAGETLTTRHRQLADALGLGALTSWPDLIETARRVFEAGPVRRAAVVDAEQALAAAEQRARDTAATLRDTENQLAEARQRADGARKRAAKYAERLFAHRDAAERNRNAWRNARARARHLNTLVDTLTVEHAESGDQMCTCGHGAASAHDIDASIEAFTACVVPVCRCKGFRPAAEPDGAALWAAIRDHAARDHQFWDRLQREHRSRPAGFPVSLR